MFRSLNSTNLLTAAAKDDAKADAALANAAAIQRRANERRLLAAKVSAKERIVELKRDADDTAAEVRAALSARSAASTERDRARGLLNGADSALTAANVRVQECSINAADAQVALETARKELPGD